MLDLLAPAADLAGHTTHILAAVPNPGQGEAPPGSDKFLTLLKWLAWGVTALCVAGVVLVGGRLAVSGGGRDPYGGGQNVQQLVFVMAGAILLGSASTIVTQLI